MQGEGEERGKAGCEVATDKESVDRDLGSSNGRLVGLPHDQVSRQVLSNTISTFLHLETRLVVIYPE